MESNSRRSFLQLAAALGALAPAAGKAAAQPVPPLPTVKFGKFEITRLIVGSNPFYGYSHFNHTLDQLMREWYTPTLSPTSTPFPFAHRQKIRACSQGGQPQQPTSWAKTFKSPPIGHFSRFLHRALLSSPPQSA